MYDQFGKAEGDQFLVNQYQPSLQNEPSVAMDAKGDFVVTWTSYGQNGNYDGIYARLFSLQAPAQGGEFMVNTTVRARQDHNDVAMDQNGDFTVVWEGYGQNGGPWEVYGQRFNLTGSKQGGEFQINQYAQNQHLMAPKVAMDLAGDFVVTWQSYGQDGSGYGIYARRVQRRGNGARQRIPGQQHAHRQLADGARRGHGCQGRLLHHLVELRTGPTGGYQPAGRRLQLLRHFLPDVQRRWLGLPVHRPDDQQSHYR